MNDPEDEDTEYKFSMCDRLIGLSYVHQLITIMALLGAVYSYRYEAYILFIICAAPIIPSTVMLVTCLKRVNRILKDMEE